MCGCLIWTSPPERASASQQLPDGVVNKLRVLSIGPRPSGKVPPDGFDGTQLRVGHVTDFYLVVLRWEVQVEGVAVERWAVTGRDPVNRQPDPV